MNLISSISEALESLTANKTRAALTMLGIVIGVGAVIAMLGLGTGTEAAITGEIESIGTNLLYVSSGGEANNPEALTLSDAEAMRNSQYAPSVIYVAPVLQGQVQVSITGASTGTSLTAITPDYFSVQTTK